MSSGSALSTVLVPGQSYIKKPRYLKKKKPTNHTHTLRNFSPFYECFACLYVCPPRPCLVPAEGTSAGAKDGYEILTLVFPGEILTTEPSFQPVFSASGLNTNVTFSLSVISAHTLSSLC